MVNFNLVDDLIGMSLFYFLGFWGGLISMFLINDIKKNEQDKRNKLANDLRKEIYNNTPKETKNVTLDNNIKHMEYLMNDPDLELFKARCRARGEVF